MKTVIFTAHPASYGFTHRIAERYADEHTQAGHEVEIVNLYDEKYKQPFLCFENIKKDCGPSPVKDAIHEKIDWSDEMVFVFPVWQMGMPAIMKNFFDTNFNAGFGFRYSPKGLEKLLKGKTARFFITADGPAWLYMLYKPVLKYITIGGFLKGYCGITISSLHAFTGMHAKRNDKARENMLKQVAKIAKQ